MEDTPLPQLQATAPYVPRFVDLVLTGVLAFVLFVVPLVIYGVIAGTVPLFGAGRLTQGAVLGAVALEAVALFGAVHVAVLTRRHIGWRDFGLRPIDQRWAVGSALVGLGCVLLLALVVAGVQHLLGRPVVSPQAGVIAPEGFSWWGLMLMLPLGGFAVPMAEELVFRGLFYRWLRVRWGVAPSAALSALLFGAVHGQLEVGIGAFLVGIILALAYERSRSLWPPIIIHAMQNSVSIVLMFLSIG
ncbi:MAG TPA: type II CAAX endopeptidase family protein [Alphaproteobacteria bacterium]|jgi:membrane protease YdiL (CAAX protease family)|nr:type II CAAX endopeptidase family protein [Alphaproteobacteria bacterium]